VLVPPVSPLRLLAFVHLYPPGHNAGAEWMMHAILSRLQRDHGIEPRVITTQPPRRRGTWGGMHVEHVREPRRQQTACARADVVITHLDATRQAMYACRRARTPLVHLVHNDRQLEHHRVTPERAQLVIFNSEWVRDAHAWAGPATVLHPPVWLEDYPPERGPHDRIVLLNLTEAKGALVFYELARRMPHRKFLGVRGAYGQQEPPPDLPNLRVIPNQRDVARTVYARAACVLMPSSYESWGRVAVEAAAAGVPCIAAPTPGLLECGAPRAFYELDDLDGWAHALDALLDDECGMREVAALSARAHAAQLEEASVQQVAGLADRLRALTG
jgi:glycosyltransferase involved in cell wall biosynthesis